jgi:hypothetical protein
MSMSGREPVVIAGAVEGLLDEAILKRLIIHAGARPGQVYGKKGKAQLLGRLGGYNQAAQFTPWAVLVDLDQDADCPPPFRGAWLPQPATNMCFRIVVREIEAWLFADNERLARFLVVSNSLMPTDPEAIPSPKEALAQLAQRSRRRDIREDIAPRPGSGRKVGPSYSSRLIQFVDDTRWGWRPEIAERSSASLTRCLRCLRRLIARG